MYYPNAGSKNSEGTMNIVDRFHKLKENKHWYQSMDLGNGWKVGGYPIDHIESSIGKWNFILKDNIPDLSGKDILDLGCNSGFFCFQSIKEGANYALGIDKDQEWVDKAEFARDLLEKKDKINYKDTTKFIAKNICNLNLKSLGKFDIIYMLNFLYHITDNYKRILKEAYQISNCIVAQCRYYEGESREKEYPSHPHDMVESLFNAGFKEVKTIEKIDPNTNKMYDRPLIIATK